VACALSLRTIEGCWPDCKLRHDDWEAAVAHLQARARPGDAIVVYPDEVRTPLDHYLRGERPRLLYPERWSLRDGQSEGRETLEAAVREAGEHPRVWLVTWWLPAEPARAALNPHTTPVDEREFQGNVHVELYRTTAAR
jgi:hypothetical protein